VGKSQRFSKYPNNSGIYKITNTINKHIYVGSTKCFRDRWRQHFSQLCNEIHDNPYLQAAFLKYGKEAFEFSVLQEVEPENDALKAAEQNL
jgi:group I intron endonuclease